MDVSIYTNNLIANSIQAVVSGKSTPDTIILQRLPGDKLTIQERRIGDKSLKITVTGKVNDDYFSSFAYYGSLYLS